MPPKEPAIGATRTASIIIGTADLASALPLAIEDVYAPVFSTPRMIALMEISASRVLIPCLEATQLSVGAGLEVTHSAATPPGVEVRAEAKYLGRKGKLFEFEIVATDPAGEIGRAKHWRAIIEASRLSEAAKKRSKAMKGSL